MSTLLYLYPGLPEPLTSHDLDAPLQAAGAAGALWLDLDTFQPAPEGPLGTGSLLTAWCALAPDAARIQAAFAARDRELLDRLYAAEVLATCSVLKQENFRLAGAFTPDEIAELEGWTDPALMQILRQARCRYTIATWEGCSALSQSLQWMLWVSLGGICRGVLEDPGTGDVLAAWDLVAGGRGLPSGG